MTLEVVCGLIFNESGQILLTQRSPKGTHPLDWEFPGGKKQDDESLEEALKRELKEEINISCLAASHFITHQHQYNDYLVNLHAFIVRTYEGVVHLNENQIAYRWINLNSLHTYQFPKANEIIIEKLFEMHSHLETD